MWRSEPGCTEATVKGGLDPDQVSGSPIGCASAIALSESSSRRTSVTITTTSSAVSFPSPFATRSRTYAASNPPAVATMTCSLPACSKRMSSLPSPGYQKEVSKQRVGDRSDGADGDKDRRPGVDSGAEDWAQLIQQRQDVRSISFSLISLPIVVRD
jgi:hypothetical protein